VMRKGLAPGTSGACAGTLGPTNAAVPAAGPPGAGPRRRPPAWPCYPLSPAAKNTKNRGFAALFRRAGRGPAGRAAADPGAGAGAIRTPGHGRPGQFWGAA
jgi:hypothetical protein